MNPGKTLPRGYEVCIVRPRPEVWEPPDLARFNGSNVERHPAAGLNPPFVAFCGKQQSTFRMTKASDKTKADSCADHSTLA